MSVSKGTHWVLLVVLLLGAFALRVHYLSHDRFHADEALYAGWALRILDDDPLLLDEPVDKPPLYLYLLAASMRALGTSEVALRLPNLAASALNVALVYRLARALYDRRTALWAAFLMACSPFSVLFARTAFTDPLLVTWTLLATYAALRARWTGSGLAFGLALATKQHALFLLPLPLALAWAARRPAPTPRLRTALASASRALLGFALPFALVTWWDAQRWTIRPGYWQQSALSYGGLRWAPPAVWAARLAEWSGWARYLVGELPLYLLLVTGSAALLVAGWRLRPRDRQTRIDTLLAGYGATYILAHVVIQLSIWDRYLLPLAPPASLLLARIAVQGQRWLTRWAAGVRARVMRLAAPALACAVAAVTLFSGLRAARNGYPIGGEHWAYQGLDQVIHYLDTHAAPDAVIYHHWLRWHYTYYLHSTAYELRYWESGAHLLHEAARTLDREQYVVLPDWRTLEPEAEGLALDLAFEARREDGSVSLQLFRIRVLPSHTEGDRG